MHGDALRTNPPLIDGPVRSGGLRRGDERESCGSMSTKRALSASRPSPIARAASLRQPLYDLTNYSVNKKNQAEPADHEERTHLREEDTALKWSLRLRQHHEQMGVDDVTLWGRIHDLVAKTMLAVEPQMVAATEMLVTHPSSCSSSSGSTSIDDELTPWLLEVNSPRRSHATRQSTIASSRQ